MVIRLQFKTRKLSYNSENIPFGVYQKKDLSDDVTKDMF